MKLLSICLGNLGFLKILDGITTNVKRISLGIIWVSSCFHVYSQTYQGPITITTGGTYSGNWQSNSPGTPAVTIQTSQPVIIQNANIKSKGIGILVGFTGADLTVKNTCAYGQNPGVMGSTAGRFLKSTGSKNIVLLNNTISSTAGIYILNFVGNGTTNQRIKINYNNFHNIEGRASTVTGYRSDNVGLFVSHAIQFDKVQDLPNVEVAWNQVVNDPFNSACNDVFNFYLSSGTPSSPMRIHDNYIQGAYPPNPITESYSGGGIIADGNPTTLGDATAWLEVYNNQVVATSNYGIAIACGHDNKFYNNRVAASGYLSPGGAFIKSQNVGAYDYNIHSNAFFYNNDMYNNAIAWNRKNTTTNVIFRNDRYFPDCVTGGCTGNTSLTANVTNATEANEYALWLTKLQNNSISLGAANCFQALAIESYFEFAQMNKMPDGKGQLDFSMINGSEIPDTFTLLAITGEDEPAVIETFLTEMCKGQGSNNYAIPMKSEWGRYALFKIKAHYRSGKTIESPIIKSTNNFEDFTLWPNPFADYFSVCSTGAHSPTQIHIYSTNGDLVASRTQYSSIDCTQLGKELTSGMYLVQLVYDEGIRSFRIVKN